MSEQTRRLLVALAHPDDESFGMAGTIAKYGSEGAEVYLICATNGDVGTVEEHHLTGYEAVADLRIAELQCAAQILGLTRLYAFGYRDSGMPGSPDNAHPECLVAANLGDVVRRISEVIREVRPHVVVTFDPYGGYGHPDHLRMHEATVRAFQVAADPAQYSEQVEAGLTPYQPQKLYYLTFDRTWLRWFVRLLPLLGQNPRQLGRNKDIDLVAIAEHHFPIHARIDTRKYAEQARAANNCHASQLGGFAQPGPIQRIRAALEPKVNTFMRAVPPANGRLRERDLFDGVRLD